MTTLADALKLAIEYQQTNRLTKAEQIYRQILEQYPQQPEALYGVGMLAQRVGQLSNAEKWLQEAIRVQPNFAQGWFGLGNLLQAQGQFPKAVECYQKTLEFQPKSVAVYNNLGYILQQQGHWEEAIATYQQALEVEPECKEADVNLGNALFAQGKLSPEKRSYYGALNQELGNARKQDGQFDLAIAYYRKAIELQPEFANAHAELGAALLCQRKLTEAIACYQKAVELDPNHADAYKGLGKIYQTQNQLKKAAAAYKQALKLVNPHYAKAVEAYQGSDIAPEDRLPPEIELPTVTVGDYQFPGTPPVESESDRPFWTVILPLYNRKQFVLESLSKILEQWEGPQQMEILVMDNNSNPPMFDLVESIAGGIMRYYRNPENIGARRNFNLGIALSRGHWIHVIPDDEYVLPGYYSRLQKSLEGCPDSVGAACTGYENINDKDEVIFSQPIYGNFRGIPKDWLHRIGVGNCLNPCAVVIRRSTHERLGCYDPGNTYTPDWELYKRIATFCDWWHEPGISARYRQHADNMTSELLLSGAQADSIRLGIEISESYLPKEVCGEITAKARRSYFQACLNQTAIPLKVGNLAAVFRLIQDALKIDSSPMAVAKLFEWMTKEEAAPIREELATKLTAMVLNENETTDSFYFAYP